MGINSFLWKSLATFSLLCQWNQIAKLEKYVSGPTLPKQVHQGTPPCKMGCWEDSCTMSDKAHGTQL